jgi:hypothetical protein
MKSTALLICTALLLGHAALANAADVEPLPLRDATAMRDAGDRLARCAGTYRGAAELMRRSGEYEAAAYAESVGFGALFAAYLLLTSPAAVEADVLADVDPNVHIEALAWGSERNFVRLDERRDGPAAEVLRACTETRFLQSSLLRGALPVLARSAS